jgi:hypothetical protein
MENTSQESNPSDANAYQKIKTCPKGDTSTDRLQQQKIFSKKPQEIIINQKRFVKNS